MNRRFVLFLKKKGREKRKEEIKTVIFNWKRMCVYVCNLQNPMFQHLNSDFYISSSLAFSLTFTFEKKKPVRSRHVLISSENSEFVRKQREKKTS